MKKLISVTVILLFIGLAFAPSINANVGKEELVEFTTEVCGLNGGKQTVKLTQQQANEVEAMFNSIREKLNNTQSREEAEDIFKDAVVELDKYGLLGGLSVKQAQRLVTGRFSNSMSVIEINSKKLDNYNFLCLIVGSINNSYVYSLSQRISIKTLFLLAILTSIAYDSNSELLQSLSFLLYYSVIIFWFGKFYFSKLNKLPVPTMFGMIGIGKTEYDLWGGTYYTPAKGWIKTSGLFGNRDWDGELHGDLRSEVGNLLTIYHIGVIGFNGIKIFTGSNGEQRYSFHGYTPLVRIESL